MTGGVQTQVNVRQAPGVQGQWASTNPRTSYVAGPGGLVAGAAGVTVGNFAWVSYQAVDFDNAPSIVNSFGAGLIGGFVSNIQQALISIYLADSSLLIPTGFGVTLMTSGDYWVINNGSGYVLPGTQCYAQLSSGAPYFFSTAPTPASGSASAVAAGTFSVTGSVQGNVLTVTAVGSGTVYPGSTISGTNVTTGALITQQLSGTTGGIGTYALDIGQMAVASGTTISGTYGLLTVGGTVVSGFGVGGLISGTNVVAGTYITALGTGTGGAGTYVVNNNTVVASTAISGTQYVATNFYSWSAAASGQLIKIGTAAGAVGFNSI
jgi:hypothetical protein